MLVIYIKLQMDNLMSIVENAIQTGLPVLLQDVMEEIDPSLEPVLTKAFVVRSGKVCHLNPCQSDCIMKHIFQYNT